MIKTKIMMILNYRLEVYSYYIKNQLIYFLESEITMRSINVFEKVILLM